MSKLINKFKSSNKIQQNNDYEDPVNKNNPIQLPTVEVVGYRPIELNTYYPILSKYPLTGHSELLVPYVGFTDKPYF